jgi:hypothetical protein
MTRSSMLEVLGEDYIRTARAKGLCMPDVVPIAWPRLCSLDHQTEDERYRRPHSEPNRPTVK